MDVKTENDFETLSSQYSQIKILENIEKSASETGTLADREMKNLLETMETRIDDMAAETADRDGAVRLRLVGMKCALWYERAKSLANTGRETEAMEVLSMTQKLIEPSLTGPELVFMSLIVLNHHSYLLSKRGELDECQALLEKAERVYQGLTSQDGPRQMFTEGDLFCAPSTPTRDKETAEKLERLVTNMLQMLVFVHNKKGEHDKFAKYSHLVLRRTLFMKDTDPVVWITRATMLASYLLTKNRFREARHHLCAASAILDQKEHEINYSEEPDVNEERRKEFQQHRADVAKYWLKYCLFLLSVSKTRMMGMFCNEPNQFMEHVWMQPFQPWDFRAGGHPQDFAGAPQDVRPNISNPLDSNLTKQYKNHKSEDSNLLKIDEEMFNTISMQGVGNKQTEILQECGQNKELDKFKHDKVDIKEIDEQFTEWKQEELDSGNPNEQPTEQKKEELGDGKQNEQQTEPKKEELGDGKKNEQPTEQRKKNLGDGQQNEQPTEQRKEEMDNSKQNEQPTEQKKEELGDGKENEQPTEQRKKNLGDGKQNEQQTEPKKEEMDNSKQNEQPTEQKKEELGDGKQNEQQTEPKKEELGDGKQNEQQTEPKKEEMGDGKQNEQQTEQKKEEMDDSKQNEQQTEQKKEELGDGKQNEQPTEQRKKNLGDGQQNEHQTEPKKEEIDNSKQNEQQTEPKKEEMDNSKQNEQQTEPKKEEIDNIKQNEQQTEKKKEEMDNSKQNDQQTEQKKEDLGDGLQNEHQTEQKKEEMDSSKHNEQPTEHKKEELGDGKQNEQQTELKKEEFGNGKQNEQPTEPKKEELSDGKQDEQQTEQKKEELNKGKQNEHPSEQKKEELGDGKQNEQPSEQKQESPKRGEEHQCDEQNLFFPNLDLSEFEERVRADFIETTEQARSMFKFAYRCLKEIKNFYNLKDHAMEYVQTIMDLSELYRYLAFYEEDIDRQYSVQKRRADTLETLSFVLRKVEPRCYECSSVNILRELAEVQLDMMGLNLRRLYDAQVAAPSMRYNAEMHSDVGARTCFEQFGDGINQEDPRILSVDDDALPYSLVI